MPPEAPPAASILFFLRHGETEWNRQRRIMGDMDIPLSPRGREQCHATARLLDGFGIERIRSSPLLRARQTAEIVAQALHVPIEFDESLVEVRFGEWQGKTYDEVRADARFVSFASDPVAHATPGGETIADVQARGLACAGSIAAGERVLLVSHGDIIRAVLCHYMSIPLSEFRRIRIDNCGLAAVSVTGDVAVAQFVNLLSDVTRVLEPVHWDRTPQK
ncbi:MAG TPA: histidine phosphatase family protein [Candidatus Limnocylindrales bacterium]|nr:histidine phosphatase family protein [Candidatus Limnocylindrales bacterium]